MKNKLYIFLLALAACSSAPVKDFKTIQYLPYDGNCFERLLQNGDIETKCYYDSDVQDEKDWVVIRKSSLNKELDYQALLINKCKKWRD